MTALGDLRVLDLSRLLPGPYASLVLADLGARVDKIEEPGAGDYLRLAPPLVGDTSGLFLAINRNKRSACLDLKKPAARDALLRLVERSDVLLEQFRPGVLDRLGLAHATLLERNPRLVVERHRHPGGAARASVDRARAGRRRRDARGRDGFRHGELRAAVRGSRSCAR
jgi:alpha-methylacyl-CoA racemase